MVNGKVNVNPIAFDATLYPCETCRFVGTDNCYHSGEPKDCTQYQGLGVWYWLHLTPKEFSQRRFAGACVKCGQTAKSPMSCLCLGHTRAYHAWQTRMKERWNLL